MLSQFPASEHGDIKAEGFAEKYNSDLANGIGNLFERVFTMALDYRGGDVNGKSIDAKIEKQAEDIDKSYSEHMENFRLFEALSDVFSLIKTLDRYINAERPWELNKNNDTKLDAVLNTLFFSVNKVAKWLEPFIPAKIGEVKNHIAKLQFGKLKKGEKLGLFPRK